MPEAQRHGSMPIHFLQKQLGSLESSQLAQGRFTTITGPITTITFFPHSHTQPQEATSTTHKTPHKTHISYNKPFQYRMQKFKKWIMQPQSRSPEPMPMHCCSAHLLSHKHRHKGPQQQIAKRHTKHIYHIISHSNTSIAARGGGGSFKRLKLYNSEEHVPIESFVTTLIH